MNEFSMYLNCNLQFETLHKIPKVSRIMHFDATGGLVNIPGEEYSRLLNHVMLVKDWHNHEVADLDKKSFVLSEMVTSRQTTYQISSYIKFMKFSYEKKYRQDVFCFRCIVTDYAWATMHAIVENLNLQTMIEYCNRVFEVSNGKKQIKDFPNTSWICSCAAHSMKRLVRALKKLTRMMMFIILHVIVFNYF
jgi:hypothetical protein